MYTIQLYLYLHLHLQQQCTALQCNWLRCAELCPALPRIACARAPQTRHAHSKAKVRRGSSIKIAAGSAGTGAGAHDEGDNTTDSDRRLLEKHRRLLEIGENAALKVDKDMRLPRYRDPYVVW